MRKAVMLLLMVFVLCATVSAQEQIVVTGESQAVVGQVLYVEVALPEGPYDKMECAMSLDESQVQLQSLPKAKGWDVDFQGMTLMLTRQEGKTENVCLQLKLKILPVAVQTKITLAFQFTAESCDFGVVTHEIMVVDPPSHENFLTELSIKDGVFAPEFHPDILQYSVAVPADCQQLDIHAVGAQKSQVEITQTAFSQDGACTVTVVVTAENGSQRSYTIQVVREKPVATEPSATAPTQPATQETEDISKPSGGTADSQKGNVPGWLVVAAVLAGAALGGAGGILLSQKKNKDR